MLIQEALRKLTPGRPAGPVSSSAGGAHLSAVEGRVIAPRRGLPSGRAVAGGLLVALAGLGTYVVLAGDGDTPTTTYLVASHDQAAGRELSAADVEPVAIDLPEAQARGTYSNVAALQDAVTRSPIPAGALVTSTDVAASGEAGAYRELSLSLEPARALAGDLVAGDRVDVVATADGTSTVVVQHARVLAVDGAGGGAMGGGDIVVTLALDDPTAALATAHAAAATDVTLLRSTRTADLLPTSTRSVPGVGSTQS